MPIRKGVFIFRMPCFLWRNASLNSRPSIYIRTFNWCFITTCVSNSFPFSKSKCKFPTPCEIFQKYNTPFKYVRKFLGMIILHLGMTPIVHFLFLKKWVPSNYNQKEKERSQNHPFKPLYLY